jgi:hypothetical protein
MYGEKVENYPVGMLNEREVRAGSGILFVIALIAFMLVVTHYNFTFATYMIIGFLVDFTIRIINPKYAPSLILGRIMVSNQKPEFVGAKQKRFAWIIGFLFVSSMSYLMLIANYNGAANLIICGVCLVLLFLETAFGICLGCKVYNIFDKEQNQYCAGGVCEVKQKHSIQKINLGQVASLLFVALVLFAVPYVLTEQDHSGHNMRGGNMDHSTMNHSTMDHSQMNHSQMNKPEVDHSKMDHSKMNHNMHH